ALVTAFALISAAVASWYWDKSVKAQQLAAMRFLAINARRAVETNNTLDGIERAGALALESIAVARKLNRPAETDALEAGRRVVIRLPLVALTHGSPLFSLVVLRNGQLASGGRDGTIKLWPEDGLGEPTVLTHGSPLRSLAVLQDGRLASGGLGWHHQALAQRWRGSAQGP